MISIIIFALAATGLWISIYFTGIFYHWFEPNVFWIPKVCQLNEKSCLNVLQTPRAKIFGIPNSALGIGLYLYLTLDTFFRFQPVIGLILITFALLRSIYLFYSLIFVTKIPCPLCFTSHGINLMLFLIYAKIIFF